MVAPIHIHTIRHVCTVWVLLHRTHTHKHMVKCCFDWRQTDELKEPHCWCNNTTQRNATSHGMHIGRQTYAIASRTCTQLIERHFGSARWKQHEQVNRCFVYMHIFLLLLLLLLPLNGRTDWLTVGTGYIVWPNNGCPFFGVEIHWLASVFMWGGQQRRRHRWWCRWWNVCGGVIGFFI